MKTSFQYVLTIVFIAIGFASCDIVDVVDSNSISVRFRNVTDKDFKKFSFDEQSIGKLIAGEESEYIKVDFKDETYKEVTLSTSINDVLYNQNLSLMMTLPGYLYCGVGLEDKLMMEQGGEFTIDVYVDKMNPSTLKTELNW